MPSPDKYSTLTKLRQKVGGMDGFGKQIERVSLATRFF
jgi:hypothetical protein